MNKDKIEALRNAIGDALTPAELIEAMDMDIYELLAIVDDDMLVDYLENLYEAVPGLETELFQDGE